MPHRRLRLATSLVLAALLLPACGTFGSRRPKDAERGLGRIVDTGELRVGMSGQQPPLNMTNRQGELFGMEVALARVLARSMGVEAKLVRRPFGELLDALDRGEVDLVMSGMTITPERGRRATFVGPYYTSGKAVLTRRPELAAAQAPQDLDRDDLRLTALRGSTSEAFVKSSLPRAKLHTTETPDEGVERVLAGKADALVADRETCRFAVLRHPDEGLLVSETRFTLEPMGIAVASDSPQLANLVQAYLTALQQSGALEKARAFWFKDPSWVAQLR